MTEPKKGQSKGVMRSLGEFVGHLWHAASRPPPPHKPQPDSPEPGSPQPETRELGRTVEEEPIETPTGSVTLRRTTIEEVVIDHPERPPSHPPSEPPAQP